MRTIYRDIVGPFIFSSDNKILMGKSRKGGVYPDTLIIPGGGVEEGETRIQALIRETKEETGIDIKNEKIDKMPGGSFQHESEKNLRDTGERVLVKMTFYNFMIHLKQKAGDVKLKIEDDFIEPIWVPADNLKEYNLSPPSIVSLTNLKLL